MSPRVAGVVPDFVFDEFNALKLELRRAGCKVTDGDLLGALIYDAGRSVEKTKLLVELYVKAELREILK